MRAYIHKKAWQDFLAHYRSVFRMAWNDRHNVSIHRYRPEEAAFLPAALAIKETPPSPLPRITAYILILLAFFIIMWAVFGRIDIVAIATGRIIVNERTKVIQPLETARVDAIHVVEGQSVKTGDRLINLDASITKADLALSQNEWHAMTLQAARARAFLTALDSGQPPQLGSLHDVPAELRSRAQSHLFGQYEELLSKLRNADADLLKRKAEITSARSLIRRIEDTLPIFNEHAEDYRVLNAEGYVARHDFLAQELKRLDQVGDLTYHQNKLQELLASVVQGERARAMLIAEARRSMLDLQNEAHQKIELHRQEWNKATARNKHAQISAPVDGVVQQLAMHTIGGIVTPAQQLMMIVPNDGELVVEAMLENKDIGFVRPGHSVEVKIDAFPYTKYGTLSGRVSHVSLDAISDEKYGLIYSVLITLEKNFLPIDGQIIRLRPGMSVGVEIRTGKRRVIEYFLMPLLQYGHESLNER